jgi:His/Glu/Gln/Arg/opine family amino acid ABC transporter permease subunit
MASRCCKRSRNLCSSFSHSAIASTSNAPADHVQTFAMTGAAHPPYRMSSLHWQFFLDDPGGKFPTYLDWMMHAWGWTVSVSLLALVIALVFGFIIGMLRTLPDSPFWVRLGNAWVELFRNIPLLVQIFLWYFVIPAFVPPLQKVPGFILVVFALGFFTSARIAEQVRSGIQALPRGPRYAIGVPHHRSAVDE